MVEYQEQFHVADGIMHVRLEGTYPVERLQQKQNLFQPLIEACEKGHCRKAVVDARDLKFDFDAVALFRAGLDAVFLYQLGLRMALVGREDKVDTFFEDVTRNRGARVEVFTDVESAIAWLNQSS